MDAWQIVLVGLVLWAAVSVITATVVGALMRAVADRRAAKPMPASAPAAVA